MSAPRHLWSGDWRQDSSAHAEQLAARRAQSGQPAERERPVPSRRPVRSPSATRMLLARLRDLRRGSGRRLRAAGLVVSLAVLSAGAAYVVTSLVVRVMDGT